MKKEGNTSCRPYITFRILDSRSKRCYCCSCCYYFELYKRNKTFFITDKNTEVKVVTVVDGFVVPPAVVQESQR